MPRRHKATKSVGHGRLITVDNRQLTVGKRKQQNLATDEHRLRNLRIEGLKD